MYFFDLKGLVDHLKKGKISSQESYCYVLGIFMVSFLDPLFNWIMGVKETSTDSIWAVLFGSAIAIAIGTWVLSVIYKWNGGDQGQNFLDRITTLNFVIGLRVSVTFLPAGMALFLVLKSLDKASSFMLPLIGLVLVIIIAGAIYWLVKLRNSLRELHAHYLSTQQTQTQPE